MAGLRLSGYDARLFGQMLPRLHTLLAELADNQRLHLFQAVHRVWDTYYPLGEESDLAFQLGQLLFELGFIGEAISYFQLSVEIYGQEPAARYNIALCHYLLGEVAQALPIVEPLSTVYPDDEAVQNLFATVKEFLSTNASSPEETA